MELWSTLLLLGTVLITSNVCDQVPVFLWGTKATIHTPALKAYDSTNFSKFVYEQTPDDAVIVVFYEQNLSTQDFAQCKRTDSKTCFRYLNSIRSSSYLPSVENPVSTLKSYHRGNHLSARWNANGSLNWNVRVIERGDIIFVSFADSRDDEPSQLFMRHDDMIRKFIEQHTSNNEIVGIYTGYNAPTSHLINKRGVGSTNKVLKTNNFLRNQNDPPEGIKLSNNRVLIYYTRLYKMMPNDKRKYDITNSTLNLVAATNKSISLTITGGKSTETLYFEINERVNTYHIENVTFNNESMRHEQISVNLPFSFHCGPGVKFRSKRSNVIVVWEGLQIEPQFYRTHFELTSFSKAWDCVGFTSPGVWMGLVVTFVLMAGLSCGFSWLFDLKTMDRFSDPNQPNITVIELE